MAGGRRGRPCGVTRGHHSTAPAVTSSLVDLELVPDQAALESATTTQEKSPIPDSISGTRFEPPRFPPEVPASSPTPATPTPATGAAVQGSTGAATQLNSAARSRTQATIHGSPQSQPISSYAQLVDPNKVEIPIDGPFRNHIEFFNEDEVLIRQPVTYEWIPAKCSHCAMMGHTEDVCKKKGVIRTEWRKIQKPSTPCQPNSECTQVHQPTADPTNQVQSRPASVSSQKEQPGAFTPVTKAASPKRLSDSAANSMTFHPNSFDALNHATRKRFHITFIYGHNHESQRQPLWEALHQISLSTHGAWCLLGDFNTILSKEDRYGGNHVEDHDIQELTNFMANCKVLEMPSSGAFFTWTNKTIWSKIDRVFINSIWHEHCVQNLPNINSPALMRLVRVYFVNLRRQLRKLNRSHLNDLKGQQESSRNALI
ncbi:hypothetical protein Cgig2_020050 [Carnegiea gigantea]|uniref:Endonuclease/exonuclease/phosphatase domain-containing protein n=1 Tax=Carnegiea gigantea TaxID=171969 RepID=A0A9Q1JGA6_9CARY|nr:hypothetical protein Cgig2_020050 [Carnegiea gigantea]